MNIDNKEKEIREKNSRKGYNIKIVWEKVTQRVRGNQRKKRRMRQKVTMDRDETKRGVRMQK